MTTRMAIGGAAALALSLVSCPAVEQGAVSRRSVATPQAGPARGGEASGAAADGVARARGAAHAGTAAKPLVEPTVVAASAPAIREQPQEAVADARERQGAAAGASEEQGEEAAPADREPPSQAAFGHGVDPERALAATAKMTLVYARPSFRSKKLGYLAAGAVVRRSAEPVGYAGCSKGWYRVAPEGHVCVGSSATIDVSDPVVRAAARRPDRAAPLPYVYGMSRFPTPPLYARLPSTLQQREVEPDLAHHLRVVRDGGWADVPAEPLPDFLDAGKPAPTLYGRARSPRVLHTGRAMVKSGFALLRVVDHGGRRFGLTTDLDLLPLDRLKMVTPSSFHGLVLNDEVTLPVVFMKTRGAYLYEGDPRTTGLRQVRLLGYREALAISGERVRVGGMAYLATSDGHWIKDERLVRVGPMRNEPSWAKPGRTWIDVSILEQSLIAYVGTKPVYVTLVSTGADGLEDPEESHATVRGRFLIHTKHVTIGMSGDQPGDEFDLRDVPYVQYFTEGYAFHAAYWHDSFGRPRSHGCINLAPLDARWLFHWTDPPVPQDWHGAMSLRDGTLVNIHP